MGNRVVRASSGRNRATLRTQLLVAFGAMGALPLVLFGIAQAQSAAESVAEVADRETLLTSTSLAREVAYMLESRVNVTKTFAGEVGATGRIDMDVEGWRARQYLDVFPGLYGAMILDLDGRSVGGAVVEADASRKAAAGLFYGDRAWVKDIQRGADFSAELLRSRLSGRPAVSFAAPIVDRSGARLGLVALGIDLERVQRALERVTEAAPGLQSVVLDGASRVVAAAGPGRVAPLDNLTPWRLYDAPRTDVERRLGRSETGELRRGTAVLVPESVVRWRVVTTWPHEAVRRRAMKALVTMAGFVLGALLLGLCAALFFLARAIARPVSRLSILIASIGGGDLRVRPSPPKAWYPRELAELIASIDGMLGQLNPLATQLGHAVAAVAQMTRHLERAIGQMLEDSHQQNEAVLRSSGAIGKIRDSIGHVATGVRSLSMTASGTTASILDLDEHTDRIAGNVRALAQTIEGAAAEGTHLQRQVSTVAECAAQLAENVARTHASLELLTESIDQVAASAERGQTLARAALAAARSGRDAVDATGVSIDAIKGRFEAVGDAVLRLSQRSEAIGEVVGVIDEVTRATRLLAINASIIAWGAGKQGSGFGVIADRVRSLASETAASTLQITDLVASVQADIMKAVEAVASGQETVGAGEVRSKEAGARLQVIIESAGQSEQTTQEIAVASHDQARRVATLASAVDEVHGATERISSAVQTQRQAQKNVASAIDKVRLVGVDVRTSISAQQEDSRAMTAAVSAMTHGLGVITQASDAQGHARDRVEDALGVFDSAAEASVEHARTLRDVMDALGKRLEELERHLGAFRVQ